MVSPRRWLVHYNDVIMSVMASQIPGVSIVYSTVCSCAARRKHQSHASLTFVRGMHRSPVDFPHKGTVTRKMFPFDDVIMNVDEALMRCSLHDNMSWQCLCYGSDHNTISHLTHEQLETHGCVLSTVSTDALVLKHQAISIHSAD